MSERKLEQTDIVQNQYVEDDLFIETDEIIDLSAVDFADTDKWLYAKPDSSSLPTTQNLYTWLRSEPEMDLQVTDNGNKRHVDSRTFTRPKKRSARMSFESIFESLSPLTQRVENSETAIEEVFHGLQIPPNKEESVPFMLKSTLASVGNLLSNESIIASGQESMEAFLHMSQSKGIDSFINLTEPDFKDPLMNISQPSILYSSITSTIKDDSVLNLDNSVIDQELLLCSMKEKNKFDQLLDDGCTNTTFSMSDNGTNVVDNQSCQTRPLNKILLNKTSMDTTFTNKFSDVNSVNLNETYDAVIAAKSTSPGASEERKDSARLSSTFVTSINTTLTVSHDTKGQSNIDSSACNSGEGVDMLKPPTSMINTHEKKFEIGSVNKNIATEIANCTIVSQNCEKNALSMTFEIPGAISMRSDDPCENVLNGTFKTDLNEQTCDSTLCPKFKVPTSLRTELLAEVQRSGAHTLDSTYNHITNKCNPQKNENRNTCTASDHKFRDLTDNLSNRYNTYRKDIKDFKTEHQNEFESQETTEHLEKDIQDRKFYTFTKKSNFTAGGKTDMENTEPVENMDATFRKPMENHKKKKCHASRTISRLPQFFQKSNPNLVSSSLKVPTVTSCASISNIGYMKGSQPNILQGTNKAVTNQLYSIGKVKSGSVQRLLEVNINAGEYQLGGAGGSTESIESTQSAHSAPDLDDRLSVCSDISHNSYSQRTMNIEEVHQIVQLQEESLKRESTPKPYRRLLENTWIEEKKDLPSPILKNSMHNCGEESSPISIDSTVVASSPILSPTRSSQLINNGNFKQSTIKENVCEPSMKNEEEINKPVESKTRLRQPTNWKTGSRPVITTSGIPRPTSRIPAPRFTRPNMKAVQGDLKKASS